MLDTIAPYYKALAGFLVPFLTSLGAAMLEASDGGNSITASEWIQAVIIGVVAGGAVFSVPNKDPNATHQAESTQPPDVGDAGHPDYDAKHDRPDAEPTGYTSGV